ncbi:hypothetical protein [Microvirga sp. 2TAF3]|uniref:hypothetical protein n=1 Tax=Microvirga sp. 2TAF3 TaxID=3233014 RepID=UPI003F96C771
MNSVVSFKPVFLATRDGGKSGRLVFAGDRLMAILVQAEDRDLQGDYSGRWLVRVGFGPCSVPPADGFATLQEVSVWVSGLIGWDDAVPMA